MNTWIKSSDAETRDLIYKGLVSKDTYGQPMRVDFQENYNLRGNITRIHWHISRGDDKYILSDNEVKEKDLKEITDLIGGIDRVISVS